MLVSAGSLDGLVGLSFGANQFVAVTVTSFAQAADGSLIDVLAQVLSTTSTLAEASGAPAYVVSGVNDAINQIAIAQYASAGGAYLRTLIYNIIGYHAEALLVSSLSSAALIAAAQSGQSVVGQIGAITGSVLATGTYLDFTTSGAFTGVLACFALGTRILTTEGEMAVERLRVGDLLPGQVSGQRRRICWIGRRTVHVARHPRPWDVAPVRICAGALAPGRPHRDLLLSPDHAILVGGALIPVRYLINGASIVQEWTETIVYLHVELDTHDVLLAEGLPCESYLDTGNRAAFPPAPPDSGAGTFPSALPPCSWRPSARVIGTVWPQQHGDPR